MLVAGGTGAVGRSLVPRLVGAGHATTALTRKPERARALERAGARAVVCDVFDLERLRDVAAEARPDVVVSQLTALAKEGMDAAALAETYARNNRVRREGTRNLLAAARDAGARRFVAQSVAFWYEPGGSGLKTEADPLWTSAPEPTGEAVRAVAEMEERVLSGGELEGVVLRYGTFYGPGTWYARDGGLARRLREGRPPAVGSPPSGRSFVHVDDAASACLAFVSAGRPGIYNVVDDEPATADEWIRAFAEAVGATPPRRAPARHGLAPSATFGGASNEKVKRELAWRPAYASWRAGFREGLG